MSAAIEKGCNFFDTADIYSAWVQSNVGGESEKRNIDLARGILSLFNKGDEHLTFVKDRPGHDFRYALKNDKIKGALGWNQTVTLQEGIERTVEWYKTNKWWWKPLKEKLSST